MTSFTLRPIFSLFRRQSRTTRLTADDVEALLASVQDPCWLPADDQVIAGV